MAKEKQERRLFPRLEQTLPFSVSANGYDFDTNTKNISCTGAYCRIKKYIPPFTKVFVKVLLPIISKNRKKEVEVSCKGVVVRTEDETEGGFNVAIFFNGISTESKNKITDYIHQFIPQYSTLSAN